MLNFKKIEQMIPLSSEMKSTLFLRTVGFSKWPLLALTSPKIHELNEHCCRIGMPFRKLIKNHHGSVYFGALAMGADACIGVLAFDKIRASGQKISFIFKSFEAEFLKRAEGPVVFICTEGDEISKLIDETIEKQERCHRMISAVAVVDNEEVARFKLELSLKARGC